MSLTKENVCVLIENKTQLEAARLLLEKHGEEVASDGTFELSDDIDYNYLQIWSLSDQWYCSLGDDKTKITLLELQNILHQEQIIKNARKYLDGIPKDKEETREERIKRINDFRAGR